MTTTAAHSDAIAPARHSSLYWAFSDAMAVTSRVSGWALAEGSQLDAGQRYYMEFTYRLDPQGRLVWLTGRGSTVQVDVQRVASVPMAQAGPMFASRPLGQLSPRDTARGTIGGADVWIDYSRPLRRGREVFGALEPWNKVWRTGANAATILETSADLVMAGTTVPAGKYTLWTIPTPTGWTLIVNKNTGQWGTEYNAQYDLTRLAMKVDRLDRPVEQFTIAIEPQGPVGTLKLEWETTRASIAFATK